MRSQYRGFSVEAGDTNFYSSYTEVPVLFLCFLLCLAPLCIEFTLFFNYVFFILLLLYYSKEYEYQSFSGKK